MPGRFLFQGLANAGQSLAGGMQQRNMNREERKRLGMILEGAGAEKDQLAEMSLGDLRGAVENLTLDTARQIQQAQAEQAQMQTALMRQGMADQTRDRQARESVLRQVGQNLQGMGRGVRTPAFQEHLDTLGQNPAVATAAATGLSLQDAGAMLPQQTSPADLLAIEHQMAQIRNLDSQVAQRQAALDRPRMSLNEAHETAARLQEKYPNVSVQVSGTADGGATLQYTMRGVPEPEQTMMERELDAVDRAREAAGLEPLTPMQRVAAHQEYLTRRVEGSRNENLLQMIINEKLAEIRNVELPAKDRFGTEIRNDGMEVLSSDDQTKTGATTPIDVEAARENANRRLFGR